ncbi:polysaccharide deacetylase family protein [Bacillus salacetis]|uniref:Polysaccharide deacetylase family protein n=2 Tax=Bacillus salacetis TaxID=2315464 RepID=A0A3A1R4L8_9BACI|nr:polysaccharide deacetylase family protein [Bacillus salacetis]
MLTFDDGPARALPAILDILRSEEVQAVFFWQTRLLHSSRPWKRVLDEGHLVGSHSTKHRNLTRLSFEEQLADLSSSKRIISEITGQDVKYFRPPFGQYNNDTISAASVLGMETMMWRIASMDWETADNPGQIIKYVTDHLENKAIILLHELPQTVQILPELIREIKQRGFQFRLPDSFKA